MARLYFWIKILAAVQQSDKMSTKLEGSSYAVFYTVVTASDRRCAAIVCNRTLKRFVLRFVSSRRPGSAMKKRHPLKQAFGMSLLLLSGCDVARSARSDLSKATDAIASATQSRPNQTQASPRRTATEPVKQAAAAQEPQRDIPAAPPVNLIGKSESEIRVLLGPPTSEEDRAPGKTWHYRDGRCTVDVQLFPDVQTRTFGTLAYEVKSDDSTDEGKRLCVAQLNSRAQTRGD